MNYEYYYPNLYGYVYNCKECLPPRKDTLVKANRFEDDDDAMYDAGDFISVESEALNNKFKSLKKLYNTDIFDNVLDNSYCDFDDLGHLLIDIRILTEDDRNDLLDIIYKLYEAEDLI